MVVLATGRPWRVAEPLVEQAGIADYVICSNGAMSMRMHDRHVIRNDFIGGGLAPSVIRAVRERLPGAGFAVEFDVGVKADAGLQERLVPGARVEPAGVDVLALADGGHPVRKVLVFHDDYDTDIPGLVEIVAGAAGRSLQVGHSGLPFVQIGPIGLSKVVALAEICDELHVAAAGVVAFGDDVNDVEMSRWAGIGVAVANASPAAKAAADVVIGSNVDDGVAVYLENMISTD